MNSIKGKSISVAIYSHPEFYPPVLNAIDELADAFSRVWVISRNLISHRWKYPDAAYLVASGKIISIRSSEQKPIWWKMISFLRFTRDFLKMIRKEKQEWVMCNDPISLFSFRLIRPFVGYPVKLWYHNHDIAELTLLRRFSVGYFAVKSEKKYFHKIDLFTLPSESRLKFFPIDRLRGKWLLVPNYPSLRRMTITKVAERKTETNLRLLYQGNVSDGHGLDEIVDFVKSEASLQLTIIGPGDSSFIHSLRRKITELDVGERMSVLDPVPYSELLGITLNHHVGLAIHEPVNVAFRTAALASNKIYEYAAAGLPIIYYSDEHYLKYLGRYEWAFPTNLSFQNLTTIIQDVRLNYHALSRAARADFQNKLNFGIAFRPVLSCISGQLVNP